MSFDSQRWEFCEFLAMGMPANPRVLPERLLAHAGLISDYGALARQIPWQNYSGRLSAEKIPLWLGPPERCENRLSLHGTRLELQYALPAWPHVYFQFAFEEAQSGESRFDWGFVPVFSKAATCLDAGVDVEVAQSTRAELRCHATSAAIVEAWDQSIFECLQMSDGPHMAHFFLDLLVLWRKATEDEVAWVVRFAPEFGRA